VKNYEFKNGDVILDLADGTLRQTSGQPVDLRPQTREVLKRLAASPNKLVTKQDFARDIWEGRQVSEDSLVQCIAEIRAAIGDTNRAVLQTVPRKGYRLVLPEARPAKRRLSVAALLAAIAVLLGLFLLRSPEQPGNSVVAVLPLADLSPGPHQGYLNDALSEGIITELARFPQFSVVARNSSFQFRDGPTDMREIGDRLGADYVVEGSQQYDGTRLRVTVQLIETDNAHHVFSKQYDREIGDLFAIQDEVVREVASALGQSVMDDLPARTAPRDVDSRLRGLQARKIMTQFSHENWQKALALEETSIREEPDSAWGYIGVSLMLVNAAGQGWRTPRDEVLDQAAELARTALRLAPDNYMSHYALARVLSTQGKLREALIQYQRAADLNPSDSLILIAMSEPLLFDGQTERAIEVLQQAAKVDPLHGDWLRWQLGWAYWQNEDCEKGLDSMLSMSAPPMPSNKSLAALYMCLGRTEDARAAMRTFMDARPEYTLQDERRFAPDWWKPEGMADRWLNDLAQAGMPGPHATP